MPDIAGLFHLYQIRQDIKPTGLETVWPEHATDHIETMLGKLKNMIDHLISEDQSGPTDHLEDHKLAAAALLVHATLIDGDLASTEQDKLQDVLQNHYDLSNTEVLELISMAKEKEKQSVDLYSFTRRLTRELQPEQRLDIIEMLWEIAFSDGILHEFEQNLIWRVAELMHVPPRERIRLRKLVEARQKNP